MILAIPVLIAIFEIYSYTAEEGMLGEFEREKYESQVVNSEYGAIGGRESSLETAMYALLHPILGTGSSGRDQDHKHLQISGHSIIFGSWAMNGIGGLIFWAYASFILLDLSKILLYIGYKSFFGLTNYPNQVRLFYSSLFK